MILVLYATLSIKLILASRKPLKHRSLIWLAMVQRDAWRRHGGF